MYRYPKIYEETLEKMLAEKVETGIIAEYNGPTDYLSQLPGPSTGGGSGGSCQGARAFARALKR